MSKQFYTLAELAERWCCSHSTALSHVRSGQLPAVDISSNPRGRSHYIVATESVEAFEAARTTTPPKAPSKRRSRTKSDIEFFT
jgi:hypothetical protein